jgi:hypothetical protein
VAQLNVCALPHVGTWEFGRLALVWARSPRSFLCTRKRLLWAWSKAGKQHFITFAPFQKLDACSCFGALDRPASETVLVRLREMFEM